MALIVEDGTGKADAETFCTVSFADAYHLKLGNTAWSAALEAAREIALRKGADYMEEAFSSRWPGDRAHEEQRLSWPRFDAEDLDGYLFDLDEVPLKVQEANAEAALLALTEDLLPDVAPDDFATRVRVDVIEIEHEGGVTVTAKRYRKVEGRLRGLISGGGSTRLLLA